MPVKEISGPLATQLTEMAKTRRFGKRGPKVDFATLKRSVWYDFNDAGYKKGITIYASARKQGFKVRVVTEGGKPYVMVLSKLEQNSGPQSQAKK